MSKIFLTGMVCLMISGCATLRSKESADATPERRSGGTSHASAVKSSSSSGTTTVKSGVGVAPGSLQTMEEMNKALEAFVLKNDVKKFSRLCKDKRFDCFVDDKLYPKSKKKVHRKVPPYASGSKMGLQGEHRVQARYDFYP